MLRCIRRRRGARSGTPILKFALCSSSLEPTLTLMRNSVRLLLSYTVPVVVAFCLFSLTWPMKLELAEIADEILRSSKNTDGFDAAAFQRNLKDPRYVELQRLLYWLQVAYIVLLLAFGALLTPLTLRHKQIADVVTGIALGILTSKILVGFPYKEWKEIFAWGAGGIALFILVLALRSRRY